MSRRKQKDAAAKAWADKLANGEIRLASEQKIKATKRKELEEMADTTVSSSSYPEPDLVAMVYDDGQVIVKLNCNKEFVAAYTEQGYSII